MGDEFSKNHNDYQETDVTLKHNLQFIAVYYFRFFFVQFYS